MKLQDLLKDLELGKVYTDIDRKPFKVIEKASYEHYKQIGTNKNDGYILHGKDIPIEEAKGKWAVINANDVLNIFPEKVVDTQKEAEKIIENYPIGIPTQREVLSRNPPMPTFNDKEKVTKYSHDLFQARGKLSEAKKILSKNRLTRNDYKTEEDYMNAISESANIEASFLEINRFIDKERENAHTYIQE